MACSRRNRAKPPDRFIAYVGNFQFSAPRCVANPGRSAARQWSRHSPLSGGSRHRGDDARSASMRWAQARAAWLLNAAGTRLYSANETDRVGDDKEGTVSAFAINRADGKLELLNTVRSGGAGPTYVSIHPSRTVPVGGQLFWRLRGGAADSGRRSSGRRHGYQEAMPARLVPPGQPMLRRAALPSADTTGLTRT